MLVRLIIVAMVAACVAPDDVSPGDARIEVARAYCGEMRRCDPDNFAISYPQGEAECVRLVTLAEMEPDDQPWSCVDRLETLSCGEPPGEACEPWFGKPSGGK